MARLIYHRPVKKSPQKRAITYAQDMRKYKADTLIELITRQPEYVNDENGKKIKNELIIQAKRYLKRIHHMSDEEINKRVKKKVDKAKFIGAMSQYFSGKRTAEQVANDYKDKGYTPELVDERSKQLFKTEIPTGMDYRNKNVQRLLLSNPTLYHKFYQMEQDIINGKVSYDEGLDRITKFLLDVALDRPEFAANIAFMLLTDSADKYSKFSFRGKHGAEVKYLMEKILTQRQLDYNKIYASMPLKSIDMKKKSRYINPEIKSSKSEKDKTQTYEITEEGMFEKPTHPDLDDIKSDNLHSTKSIKFGDLPVPGSTYFVLDKKDPSKVTRSFTVPKTGTSFKNIGFTEKPKYRKKKIKAPIRRKKSSKVIKVRKPIKKCRCK